MVLLRKIVSRHAALPIFILALLLIGLQFMKVHADRDKGVFYLKDHEGNQAALSDVTISGELGDGFHGTLFNLANGKVATDTKVFDPPRAVWYNSVQPDKVKGKWKFDNVFSPDSIVARDPDDPGTYRQASVYPNITEYDENKQPRNDNTATYTNRLEYGLANIGDQYYFVVPSTNSYVGTSGIYRLHFIDGRDYNNQLPASEALATFSLDKNKGDGSSEIQVLGLEAVGDKLALVLEEDQKLVIRSYDSKSGESLGEAAVSGFSIPGSKDKVQGRSFYESYEAYSDSDSSRLSLAFMSSPDQGQVRKTVWSFDLADGVKLLDETAVSYPDDMESNLRDMKSIHYINGKLYVIYQSTETKDESDIVFDIARPKHLMIRVYKAARLQYEGELVTDRNQDSNRVEHLATSYDYNPMYNREFDHISIRSAE
ncbi:hypothetical protein [Paenibacillus sp. JDR-2]|uniref:hypothetical protein n=1 Tax=Paenibacillus sp. (strain JDR-2) TaxID=324057 RepID=UPI000166A2DA|nr:hypothetical protein [Paenibacillus sp. JDR-2]ACT00554.1 hypothetical protein Pjdr2_1897 [Paenibacillus sp. JDR-2]